MTPDREDEHRTRAAKGLGGAEAVIELLTALDEVRAREGRLREAVTAFFMPDPDDGLGPMESATESLATIDAALADPSATTWLAGRERAARVAGLREAAEYAGYDPQGRDAIRALADAIEAGREETP